RGSPRARSSSARSRPPLPWRAARRSPCPRRRRQPGRTPPPARSPRPGRSLGRLGGTRRTELGAVLANARAIAAAGQLTASRLPALFLTLERNRHWWTSEPLLSSGERVSFPGSRIVWEYYPGQGLEIQWLATFGEANGYFL